VPIPSLTSEGLLPEGIHNCSLEELRERFGSFRSSDRRPQLYRRLDEFVMELRRLEIRCSLIVNGSFVTSEPQPNDIDLILVLPSDWNVDADLPPSAYNVMSKRRVRRIWRFDLLVACKGTDEYNEHVEFFQQVRHRKDRRKGMLQLTI
jgi:hypothetical protein